jgi:hypothetical protein
VYAPIISSVDRDKASNRLILYLIGQLAPNSEDRGLPNRALIVHPILDRYLTADHSAIYA